MQHLDKQSGTSANICCNSAVDEDISQMLSHHIACVTRYSPTWKPRPLSFHPCTVESKARCSTKLKRSGVSVPPSLPPLEKRNGSLSLESPIRTLACIAESSSKTVAMRVGCTLKYSKASRTTSCLNNASAVFISADKMYSGNPQVCRDGPERGHADIVQKEEAQLGREVLGGDPRVGEQTVEAHRVHNDLAASGLHAVVWRAQRGDDESPVHRRVVAGGGQSGQGPPPHLSSLTGEESPRGTINVIALPTDKSVGYFRGVPFGD